MSPCYHFVIYFFSVFFVSFLEFLLVVFSFPPVSICSLESFPVKEIERLVLIRAPRAPSLMWIFKNTKIKNTMYSKPNLKCGECNYTEKEKCKKEKWEYLWKSAHCAHQCPLCICLDLIFDEEKKYWKQINIEADTLGRTEKTDENLI